MFTFSSSHPLNTTASTNIVKFAKILAGRFVPKVGCTRSWDGDASTVTVIIGSFQGLSKYMI